MGFISFVCQFKWWWMWWLGAEVTYGWSRSLVTPPLVVLSPDKRTSFSQNHNVNQGEFRDISCLTKDSAKLPPVFRSIPFVLLGTGKYFQKNFNSNMAVTLKCGVSCQILFILLTKRKRQRMRMLGIKRSVPLLSSLDS